MRVAAFIFVLFSCANAYGQVPYHSDHKLPNTFLAEACSSLGDAAKNLVRETWVLMPKDADGYLPEKPFAVSVEVYNDLTVENGECMANAVISMTDAKKNSLWTLFHVHFFTDGTWIFKNPWLPRWQKLTSPQEQGLTGHPDWFYEWCGFIETVYENELRERGCEE